MSTRLVLPFVLGMALSIPSLSAADPPSHAPAHGYRAKQRYASPAPAPRPREGGVEVVFDSERGVRVAIGLPNVFFDGGLYYRRNDKGWQVSATGSDGWRVAVASRVPEAIRKAGHVQNSGPASPRGPQKGRRKQKK